MKPQLAIRANGNPEIGLGHIHRTLAYAAYISDLFDIVFYINQTSDMVYHLVRTAGYNTIVLPANADIKDFTDKLVGNPLIVLDGYMFNTQYQEVLKTSGYKLIMIDDLNAWLQLADVVINHAYTGPVKNYLIGRKSKLFTGFNYSILKDVFLEASFSGKRRQIHKILISIGGTDPNAYILKIVKNLLVSSKKHITIITYTINSHYETLKQLSEANQERCTLLTDLSAGELIHNFASHDLAILQPSNIALEACTIGIGMVLLQTADNQKFVKANLLQNGCAIELTLDTMHIVSNISIETVNKHIEAQSQMPFKEARKNHRYIITDTFLSFRQAEFEDMNFVYECNNDKRTRQNSYNQNTIEYISHVSWYGSKIQNLDNIFLIFTLLDKRTGIVRIDKVNTDHIIGITIAATFRGLGMATTMLRKACRFYFVKTDAAEITAYIKVDNITSYKAFLKAGFYLVETKLYNESESFKMILKNERY